MNALAASLMTHTRGKTMAFHSVADPGFPIPGPDLFIPNPGSRVYKIPDPDPRQRISVFLTSKIVSKL
jgi:hypothetical protein